MMATETQIDGRLPLLGSDAVATRLGHAFVNAIVDRDFDAVEALLAPNVRFRALTPRAVREGTTPAEARDWIWAWFGETDQNELIDSRIEMVADRLHLAYRIRLREHGAWYLVEQHLFGSLADEHLTEIALLCSGFRSVQAPTEGEPGGPSVGGRVPDDPAPPAARMTTTSDQWVVHSRFDAIGKSCATLTPDIAAAVRHLDPGQVLEIVADDETAEGGLRAWTRLTGNELVETVRSDGPDHFFIRRGGSTALRH
jgi:tRNA 2-thiouridine synthesizing protein A